MNARLLFRIFYQTVYWSFVLALTGLILITPGDIIVQVRQRHQIDNAVVIGICYSAVGFLAVLFIGTRRYTTAKTLKEIPKTYIPVEKGDVKNKVRKMIAAGLSRSVAIAWNSRPRIESQPPIEVSEPNARHSVARPAQSENEKKARKFLHKRRSGTGDSTEKDDEIVEIPPPRPVWGEISHNGWSSPLSPDLPNLQYITVILELPHLIEARAVSVAPPDPDSDSEPPMPDIRAVDLLQRPLSMGLRDYVGHLIDLEVITSPATATDFLNLYEYARVSGRDLNETQFRDLMKLFADLLRSMQALNPIILASLDNDSIESDIDDDNSSTTTPRSRSLASIRSSSTRSGSEGTIRTARTRPSAPSRSSTAKKSTGFNTAPATPQRRNKVISKKASADSFAQSRPSYNGSGGSSESLASSSQGSVIRLNPSNEESELPYTLHIPRAR